MRTRSKRRAISYIMSVAVMTFVTVSMASVVLLWSIGQTSQSQNTFTSAINARVNRAMERFVVEDVHFLSNAQSSQGQTCSDANGCVLIYIRNVGSIQLVIDAVYVNYQLFTQSQYTTSSSSVKLSLAQQQLGWIFAPAPTGAGGLALTAGTTYNVAAASTRGNTVAVSQTF